VRTDVVAFTFDARPMTAEAGQTVGAALLAAGVRSRACLVTVREGDEVRTSGSVGVEQ
jgi:hypothetical protein